MAVPTFRFVLTTALLTTSMALKCYSGEKPHKHTITCSAKGAQCFKSILANGWMVYGCANGCKMVKEGEKCTNDGAGRISCCCSGDLCNLAMLNRQHILLGIISLTVTIMVPFV